MMMFQEANQFIATIFLHNRKKTWIINLISFLFFFTCINQRQRWQLRRQTKNILTSKIIITTINIGVSIFCFLSVKLSDIKNIYEKEFTGFIIIHIIIIILAKAIFEEKCFFIFIFFKYEKKNIIKSTDNNKKVLC